MVGKRLIAAGLALLAISAFAKDRSGPLSISAKSGIIIDANSGAVLWSKNADAQRYPASTTKIMTALLLLQNRKLSDVLTAPYGIEKVPPSSMHLRSGEKITVHDLLYAMLLRSANDGAITVAYNVAGNRVAFAKMMNDEAARLGCTDTHFDNPNGLDDPNHWTTAADMAKIARAAMQIPFFREVVCTQRYTVTRSMNQRDRLMVNRDKILRTDPTEDGIKTGWTVPAGHCFVGSATRNGFRIITVEFQSNGWVADNEAMMNWAFTHFDHTVVAPAGKDLGVLNPSAPKAQQVPVGINEALEAIVPAGTTDASNLKVGYTVSVGTDKPITKGQEVGKAFVTNPEGIKVGEAPLVALADAPAEPVNGAKGGKGLNFNFLLIGGVVVSTGYFVAKFKLIPTKKWPNFRI